MSAQGIRIGIKPKEKDCEVINGQEVCKTTPELIDINPHDKSDIFLGHAYLVVILCGLEFCFDSDYQAFHLEDLH